MTGSLVDPDTGEDIQRVRIDNPGVGASHGSMLPPRRAIVVVLRQF